MGTHKQHNYYSVSGLLLLSKTYQKYIFVLIKCTTDNIDRLIVIEEVSIFPKNLFFPAYL
jgi:hypothetical protein